MPLPPEIATFAHFPLDRAALRADPQALAAARDGAGSKFCAFVDGLPLLTQGDDGSAPVWLPSAAFAPPERADAVFLGVDETATSHFAAEIAAGHGAMEFGAPGDLRMASVHLRPEDAALLGCAKHLIEWRRRHSFCANCGVKSEMRDGGWRRVCPACKAEHFPRVSPVAIMVVASGRKCVLGRQRFFPPDFYSALAGFVEPAETLEQACARETMEEAGIVVNRVRYLFSQPWPFPDSLMFGLIADAEYSAVKVDEAELETARWFDVDEVEAMLTNKGEGLKAPTGQAIAHHILAAWVREVRAAGL